MILGAPVHKPEQIAFLKKYYLLYNFPCLISCILQFARECTNTQIISEGGQGGPHFSRAKINTGFMAPPPLKTTVSAPVHLSSIEGESGLDAVLFLEVDVAEPFPNTRTSVTH